MAPDPLPLAFLGKKLLSALLLPPGGPLLLIGLGLALLGLRRRTGLILAWSGLIAALAFSTPLTVAPLARALEAGAVPLVAADLAGAQAIVILGGGKRSHAPEYGGETLNRLSLERVRYGAWLATRHQLPLLVAGGVVSGNHAEADLMKAVLEDEYGVSVQWVERRSRDTRENARNAAQILHQGGVRRIVLVTHALHMARSRAEFEAAGLEVVAAPTAWLGGGGGPLEGSDVLPGANAAYTGWFAAHEAAGRLVYRWTR